MKTFEVDPNSGVTVYLDNLPDEARVMCLSKVTLDGIIHKSVMYGVLVGGGSACVAVLLNTVARMIMG